jgi:hypothetical protein
LGRDRTNPPMGETFPENSQQRKIGALVILDPVRRAIGVVEIELAQIAREVLRAAKLVDVAHPALEDAEKAFDLTSATCGWLGHGRKLLSAPWPKTQRLRQVWQSGRLPVPETLL